MAAWLNGSAYPCFGKETWPAAPGRCSQGGDNGLCLHTVLF